MFKLLANLIQITTEILHWALSFFVEEKTLLDWKPIPLCWWFKKHGWPIPKYFIGAVFASSDDFESYSDGSVVGGNGGSGWGGVWTNYTGQLDGVIQGITKYQGSKALDMAGSAVAGVGVRRVFSSAVSGGSLYFAFNVSGFHADSSPQLYVMNSSDVVAIQLNLSITAGGHSGVQLYYNGGFISLFDIEDADTWYVLNVEWDDVNQANKCRVRIRTATGAFGSFTDWISSTGDTTNLSSIAFYNSISTRVAHGYIDSVQATDPVLIVAATVTTQAVTNKATTSGTGNGNITATGGANATRRGVCYMAGTSGDPTTANSVAYADGDFGTGAYTQAITGLTAGTAYRVRAYAVNSAGTSYGDTVNYLTTAEVSVTKGLVYAIKSTPAAKTKGLIYKIKAPVSSVTKSLKYCVKQSPSATAAPTKSLKYTVRITPSGITKGLIYDVKITPAAITKGLVYGIKSPVAPTKSLKYCVKVVAAGNPSKSLQYEVKITPSAVTKSLGYKILFQTVSIQKSLQYEVKQSPAAIQESLKYTVTITPAAKTKSLQYAVKPSPSVTKALKYTIIPAPISITKGLVYEIKTIGAIQKQTQYAVKQAPSSKTKSLQYAILFQTVGITKSLQYGIRTNPAIQRSLKYAVLTTPTGIQKDLSYIVIYRINITKGLQYVVKSPVSITKSLAYEIKSSHPITKSLKYTVEFTPAGITKSMGYVIRVYPYKKKASPYHSLVHN